MSTPQLLKITPFHRGSVRGFFHHPSAPPASGLVLTHGAGSNCEAPLLVAFATAFCEAGVLVFRGDLPFRQKRPHGPPPPAAAAEDRSGLRDAVIAVREITSGPLFLGGHSYGGRQATLLAAADHQIGDALLLL